MLGVTLIQREEVTSSRLCSRAGLDLLISAGWETWQVGIKAAVLTKSQQQPCDPRSASHPVLCWVSLHAVLHYSPAGSVLAGSVVTALWCLPPWIWSCSKWSLPLYCYFFYTEREECFCWSLSEGLRILGGSQFLWSPWWRCCCPVHSSPPSMSLYLSLSPAVSCCCCFVLWSVISVELGAVRLGALPTSCPPYHEDPGADPGQSNPRAPAGTFWITKNVFREWIPLSICFFPSTFSWKQTVAQRCRWPQHWWLVIWSALDMNGCLHPRTWIQDSVQTSNSEFESAQLCLLLWPLLEWHT